RKKVIHSKEFSFTVIYEPLEEGGFNVIFPDIPEICTFGRNLKEAREMAKDALLCYLESALKSGEIIPKKFRFLKKPIKEKLAISFSLK
ncbi:MAG: type II toxin-antitoxin system HicB family antitoxin, partial [Ignavibacterium sp.]